MNATKTCHKECGHNFICHFSCPRPFHAHGGAWNAHKIWKAIKHVGYHFMCSDEACHKECGSPWERLEAMCGRFETVKECHQKCGTDRECHHNCPHWHDHDGHDFHARMGDW